MNTEECMNLSSASNNYMIIVLNSLIPLNHISTQCHELFISLSINYQCIFYLVFTVFTYHLSYLLPICFPILITKGWNQGFYSDTLANIVKLLRHLLLIYFSVMFWKFLITKSSGVGTLKLTEVNKPSSIPQSYPFRGFGLTCLHDVLIIFTVLIFYCFSKLKNILLFLNEVP